MTKIDSFSGEFSFLSNFYPCSVLYEDINFPTTEHAFQASKSRAIPTRQAIAKEPTAAKAKKAGKSIALRPDWELVKFRVMEDILRLKFAQSEFRDKLLETGDAELIEGNQWGDTTWGICNGVGKNMLGKLLMKIRSELRQ